MILLRKETMQVILGLTDKHSSTYIKSANSELHSFLEKSTIELPTPYRQLHADRNNA
jgi:hypothetical protein